MRVVAIEMGFYGGHRIRPGQEFDALDGDTARWFVPVSSAQAEEAKKQAVKPAMPRTLSEMGKARAMSATDDGIA
jgi:hypothetical protein